LNVNNIIISSIEHNSIIKTCEYLKDKNINKIKANEDGIIDIDDLKSKLENVELISVMLANNEIGSIQPLMEIRKICPNIKIHSDIAQAVGKIQVDVKKLNIDYASFSAHKIYGPKGIGAIYVKGGVDNISSFMHGGGHEKGVRAGTHNVPAIVGFGKACEILENRFARDMYRIECMKMKMYSKLKDSVPEIKFHGDVLTSLPSCLNFSVPCGNPDVFITTLNQNVAVSFGSACLSLTNSLSHVLLAMGVPEEEIKRTVRVSIGRFNTMEEIELASDYIIEAINIAK
jgi:cysteine desulfurase